MLGAVIVSAQDDSGTFIATFANNNADQEAHRPVAVRRATAAPSRSTRSRRSRSRPAAWSTSPPTAASASPAPSRPGDFVPVTVTFGNGAAGGHGRPGRHRQRQLRRPRHQQLRLGRAPSESPSTSPSESPSESPSASADRRDPRRVTMTYTLILLRHGESEWNAKNLFTGWVDVDLDRQGPRPRPSRGGELLARGRAPARRRAHLAAAPGDHHRPPRPRRRRPALDPGAPLVAAQRAPLRRAAGQGQEADARGVRRGAVHALAPLLRRPAAARSTDDDEFSQVGDPRYADLGDEMPAHRVPQGRHRPDAALLGVRHRRRTCAPAGRCWSPRTATACARSSSTSTGSATRTSPA